MSHMTTDDLIRDLGVVVDDLQLLTKAAAHDANAKVVAARSRAEQWARTVQGRLRDVEQRAVKEASSAAKDADTYVREHAWETISAAAQAGIALDMILNARHRDKSSEA